MAKLTKITLNENTTALEYQYDEIVQFSGDEVLESTEFKTGEEAKAAFEEVMHELNLAEEYRIEFTVPKFVSQRMNISKIS